MVEATDNNDDIKDADADDKILNDAKIFDVATGDLDLVAA
jgi:hypothetical protein